MLVILADPKHPEYEERLEWVGGQFDPKAFDVADVADVADANEALSVLR